MYSLCLTHSVSPSVTEVMAKRVAVILSGCGVYDGTEVHEASAVLVHLSRAGAKVTQQSSSTLLLCIYSSSTSQTSQSLTRCSPSGADVCSQCGSDARCQPL